MPSVKRPPRTRQTHFLRQWRKYRGLTQEEVGERIEVNASTLSRVERGEIPYDQDLLERLALVYLCEPADLLSIDPLKPDPPKLVYDRLRSAPDAIRDQALAVLNALLKAS